MISIQYSPGSFPFLFSWIVWIQDASACLAAACVDRCCFSVIATTKINTPCKYFNTDYFLLPGMLRVINVEAHAEHGHCRMASTITITSSILYIYRSDIVRSQSFQYSSMSFCFDVFHKAPWWLVSVPRLRRCYRGCWLPRTRDGANTVVADYFTKQTVLADYRGNVPCKCRGFLLLHQEYRGFVYRGSVPCKCRDFWLLSVPWLPWFSLTAEACHANAVISDYCTATAVLFAYCGTVPCKYRNRE